MSLSLPPEIAGAVTNRGLNLIINSSEQCNLRCVYCYESFSIGHMKLDLARGIVNLVRKRVEDGLEWLEIDFFGGEPLGAWNTVEYVTGNIHELCRRHGVTLLGGMTTNSTLLHQGRFDWLVKHGITAFQVTLDGPREIHDARRVSLHKTGSFDVIWKRLAMMKASTFPELDVVIRVHFDADSWPSLVGESGFVATVVEAFLRDDLRFRLHFNPVEQWGAGSAEGIRYFASHRDALAAREKILACVAQTGLGPNQVPQLLKGVEVGESGHTVCYAARANAFVVRADGAVSKCTVAFNDDRNVVGRITSEGDLIIDHKLHAPWMRGLVSGDASELACPARGHIWPV